MTAMHPILARFHDEPALVSPDSQALFASLLGAVAGFDKFEALGETANSDDGFWFADDDWRKAYRPYSVRDGVLQIPVKGVLLHDFPYQLGDWATGYEYILRAFERGCEDFAAGNIKGIALVINSPGGMVAGCFDAADKVLALKAEHGVPVRSYAAESAYSAAYVWACVGDSITVSRTGGVGSIGVVMSHVDLSGAMEQAGVKVTFIHAGAHKVDGNAFEPLPDDVRARFQGRIDDMYAIFVEHVAANRPLDDAAVRATEAQCFTASQAKSNGLADEIGALDDSLAVFAADLSNPPDEGEEEMSESKDKSAGDPAAEQQEQNPAPVATVDASAERRSERERISAITTCDEAEGRSALASHLALNTEMSVDDAKGILAAAEKVAEPAATGDQPTPFGAQMDDEEQPDVGASQSGADADQDDPDSATAIVALASRVGLKGFAQAPA